MPGPVKEAQKDATHQESPGLRRGQNKTPTGFLNHKIDYGEEQGAKKSERGEIRPKGVKMSKKTRWGGGNRYNLLHREELPVVRPGKRPEFWE